jgi:hypothetical protein
VVHVEVEHDAYGLLMVGGKILRGLLRDSWHTMQARLSELAEAGCGVLDQHADLDESTILAALTDTRSQPPEERHTGAPAKDTLRSVRVILRGLQLKAPLVWLQQLAARDLQRLALAWLATRHAGVALTPG